MPYIKPERRPDLDEFLDPLLDKLQTGGELSYVIYRCMHALFKNLTDVKGSGYCPRASIAGFVETTKAWWNHEMVFPYEELKKAKNGDVRK